MRYPSLPLVNHGGDAASPVDAAWSALGADLPEAMRLLDQVVHAATADQDRDVEIAARLGLAEGRRRQNADRVASALAEEAVGLADAFGTRELRVAARLVLAVARWDEAALDGAVRAVDDAESLIVTDLERAIAMLARARTLRYRSQHQEARRLAEAADQLIDTADLDASADVDRELAANFLMLGEFDAAGDRALRALHHHRRTGDRYREAQALVLVGRSFTSTPGDRLDHFRRAADVARALGSPTLEATVRIHTAQLLQTGATPGSPRWHEANEQLDRAQELATDAIATAEISLTRAHLEIERFDPFARADVLLDQAAVIYQKLDNVTGMASTAKARARLATVHALGSRGRARIGHRARAMANYLRARRLYLQAGMQHTSRRLTAERRMASRAITGRDVDVDQARRMLAESDLGDPHDRTRRLLILAESLLASHGGRGALAEVAELLTEARELADATDDDLLRAAVAFGVAELAVVRGQEALAAVELQSGLQVLAGIDLSLNLEIGRARFVDTLEPVTRRALRTAAAIGDARTGLYVLEVRRSGRLAGLFRQRGRVHIDPDVAALLARIEQRRAVDGGILRGIELSANAEPDGSTDELRSELAQLTSDAFAELYDPGIVDIGDLLGAVPPQVEVLVLDQADPADPSEIVCATATNGESDEVLTTKLSGRTLDVLRLLASDDGARDPLRAQLRPSQIAGLTSLFPPGLRRRLEDGRVNNLLVVPSGLLWSVPWAAVPFEGDRLLVELAALTVTPSLRMHALVGTQPHERIVDPVLTWVGEVSADQEGLPELEIFGERGLPTARPETPESALRRISTEGSALGAIALAVHGDAEPGLGHGVHLGGDTWLRAYHLLGAELPPHLFIGACHSAFSAGDNPVEPIGLPTVAMCAGARSVIAASTRIPDTRSVSELLAIAYRNIIEGSVPATGVRIAQLQHLDEYGRAGPIVNWAPITAIGTAPTASE